MLVPEEHDGLGLGLVEAQVIARALGAGVAPGPVARHRARRRGDPAGRLGRAARGVAAPAGRRGRGGRARDPRHARPGRCRPSSTAAIADVAGRPRPADGLALVDGADRRPRAAATTAPCGWPTSTGGRRRRRCPAPSAEVLAELTARGTVLVAADLVGIAREALTRTVAYDRERQQFGVPVGLVPGDQARAGRPARRGHAGRARRALRRARAGRPARRRRAGRVGGQGQGRRRRPRRDRAR